ncbi:preprotein translocase subunit SecA [Acinetobacter sp. 194]|uniref:preprotein translocase subunit SecA n=1 Tax=Acinetobacter shaoyimingii TaxID=2715164 RepID=UPI00140E9602|nr:preprotein translocase subunit SecA [Acinetobacter shaoyimingii]NHB58816.1 preprotein translocase subunit SecA [Acinetobacter shaoyimingii]
MTEQKSSTQQNHPSIRYDTMGWKLFLIYDIFMMVIIIINLFCIVANAFLLSNFASWLFDFIHLSQILSYYKDHLVPWVNLTESWFIIFLIVELGIRWFIAIIQKHHARWFFFPFVHWYEVLAIIPYLRFLRLIRAGVIAFRLQELGYIVIPPKLIKRFNFYYHLVMEELSDRVVITVLDGVKKELDTSSTHKQIIHDLVDHHRDMFAQTLADILQETLATELKAQQQVIADSVGDVVVKAIEDTPELTQLLKLIPIAGGMIESRLHAIGHRLGENVTIGLMQPFVTGSVQKPNSSYQLIAEKLSQLNINNQSLEQLVESVVYESLESMRKQVAVKQWQLELKKNDQLKE